MCKANIGRRIEEKIEAELACNPELQKYERLWLLNTYCKSGFSKNGLYMPVLNLNPL